MSSKLKMAAKLFRESMISMSEKERYEVLNEFLDMVRFPKDVNLPPKRSNREGTPVECPYGIFVSHAAAARFIYENHKTEYLKKYTGFKIPPYSKRSEAMDGNTPELHYIYHSLKKMCRDKNYSDWYILEYKIKE